MYVVSAFEIQDSSVSDTVMMLITKEWRLEESLGTTEPLVSNGDDLSVGQLVALLQGGRGGSSSHFLLEVQSNVTQLLLDVTHNLTLGWERRKRESSSWFVPLALNTSLLWKHCGLLTCGGEAVAPLCQDLHEVVGQVPASQVQPEDGVGQGVALVDGHCVGDTISRVHDDTSGTTRGVQGQHSLDGHVHGRSVEGLKHDLEEREKEKGWVNELCKSKLVLVSVVRSRAQNRRRCFKDKHHS